MQLPVLVLALMRSRQLLNNQPHVLSGESANAEELASAWLFFKKSEVHTTNQKKTALQYQWLDFIVRKYSPRENITDIIIHPKLKTCCYCCWISISSRLYYSWSSPDVSVKLFFFPSDVQRGYTPQPVLGQRGRGSTDRSGRNEEDGDKKKQLSADALQWRKHVVCL